MAVSDPPVMPKLAAALLLLRDGAGGLEVLTVTRHARADFAAGALVFPGGKVEAGDAALRSHCPGVDGLDDAALALRVAAIRETFEEAGLLLALDEGGAPAPVSRLPARRGGASFAELITAAALPLAAAALIPFAHWITPPDRPRRFDTHFFVALAPCGQNVAADGHETVGAHWLRPTDALADGAAGRRVLNLATLCNLGRLARHATAEQALAAAVGQTMATVIPETIETTAGPMYRIPADAGYEECLVPAAKVHRA
jgi:8-oxo-dGTP pyrophosphatase MutT (NUDIX family)